MIKFINKKPAFKLADKKKISDWIAEIIISKSYYVGSINYIFTDDSEILNINKQFLGHDYYTDIITFDTSSYSASKNQNAVSADIFISIDTVEANSVLYNVPFLDELYRVMIHGILHLTGYDDLSEDEKSEMRSQENTALSILSING